MIQTLRDNPQDAEIDSHKLLVRAGIIKKLAGGLYTFMPLGMRTLRKIENIVREEMDAAKKRRVGFLVGAIVYLQIIALLCFQSGIVVLVGVLLVVMRLMKRFLPEVRAS